VIFLYQFEKLSIALNLIFKILTLVALLDELTRTLLTLFIVCPDFQIMMNSNKKREG